ncbi:MAG: hypothetical protein WCF90_01235 [Methanomicrobiales archaeon]
MANIIAGIIQYAINNRSPDAIEKAYFIAQEIGDPVLKTQLCGRISDNFIKIGCIRLKDSKFQSHVLVFSTSIPPFERALEIVKVNVKTPQISLKIAGLIDVIISYSKTCDNPDFIIPLAMYAVEICNPLERDAMMSRIISNLNDKTPQPGSTDSYEILAYLLQKNVQARSNPVYSKVVVLADLTTLFCHIDQKNADKCLNEGIAILHVGKFPDSAKARKQIVFAIVRMYTVAPDEALIDSAFEIVSPLKVPVDYINSLIAISRMIKQDDNRCTKLLKRMMETTEKIPSPYEHASIILDIIPFALQSNNDELVLMLLKKADTLTKSINIEAIADIFRDKVAQEYLLLYSTRNEKKYLIFAIDATQTIDDDGLRLHRLVQMGQKDSYEISPHSVKIRAITEKIISDGAHTNQIASHERIINSVADRGKEAFLFCNLSILFRNEGNGKFSKRMLQNAIKEARIIRPLSRRAFVMCYIAMKIHAVGCEIDAQELLDYAIDAATNIRQSNLRDEVFDELGLAIKIMQEI